MIGRNLIMTSSGMHILMTANLLRTTARQRRVRVRRKVAMRTCVVRKSQHTDGWYTAVEEKFVRRSFRSPSAGTGSRGEYSTCSCRLFGMWGTHKNSSNITVVTVTVYSCGIVHSQSYPDGSLLSFGHTT